MPIWSEVLEELSRSQPPNYDRVRRKYLFDLHQHTKRNTILYATGWLQRESSPSQVSIGDEDIQALMEVSYGLKGEQLDLILHSPGGSPEAAEAVISYLRSRITHIRVIVPQLAMSAATMIACAADEIVLGKHSFLGPTDPQLLLQTNLGARAVPAQAVLDQFDQAKEECADSAKLAAWLPMLNQYGPDVLVQYESALKMSKDLVRRWLESYMYKDSIKGAEKAKEDSAWLANPRNFLSHNRHISRQELEQRGLKIIHLESDEETQDLALSIFHTTTHTFTGTRAVKIVENHDGRAFVKLQMVPPAH